MIGLSSSREPGRHRDGQPLIPLVHRRVWDGPARAEAERLDQKWPSWTVLYSLGNRRFYAVASWLAPQPVLVESDTATDLETQIYGEEMARITRGEAPSPAPASPPSDRHGDVLPQTSAAVPHHPRHPYRSVA